MISRCDFQRKSIDKRFTIVLNIGSKEDPCRISDIDQVFVVNVDIDLWKLPNFIQCDAHKLPFRDYSFDYVILGDVLEHLVDPRKGLKEAVRVCRKNGYVVITVPLEPTWRIGKEKKLKEIQKLGYSSFEEWKLKYQAHKGLCIKPIPDDEIPHTYHIHVFTEEQIIEIIKENNLEIVEKLKIIELKDPETGIEIPHLLLKCRKIL